MELTAKLRSKEEFKVTPSLFTDMWGVVAEGSSGGRGGCGAGVVGADEAAGVVGEVEAAVQWSRGGGEEEPDSPASVSVKRAQAAGSV